MLASLGAKTGVLRRQLADVGGQLQTFNRDQLRIAVLARDVELCQADYRKYSSASSSPASTRRLPPSGCRTSAWSSRPATSPGPCGRKGPQPGAGVLLGLVGASGRR